MYTRRNSNRPFSGPRWAATVVAAGVVIVVLLTTLPSSEPQEKAPAGGPGLAPADAVPARNPIDEMLKPPSGPAPQEGTAAAILMDVSGSMGESVKDAAGRPKPKIEIAKACLLDLVGQADRFARQHTDRRVRLGVYEFSSLDGRDPCRRLIALGEPDPAAAQAAVARMSPNGSTPIGDAILRAKRDLNASGWGRQHILVITDGENNRGYSLSDVVSAIYRQPEENRASVYLIAFDVAEAKFAPVRQAGAMVLGASNESELQQTLDYVLTGKILAEQPETPRR